MIEDLTAIADRMDELLPLFRRSGSFGLILETEYSASFKALAIEAKGIIDSELGHGNDYSFSLKQAVRDAAGGFISGPSYASVQEVSKIIRAAVRDIQRKRAKPLPAAPSAKPYVDHARIVTLQSIGAGKWDFKRLVELCREINVAAANRCHMTTAMLLRTIINHVPPVLGFDTFAEVASNYGGAKTNRSFKASMQHLQGSLRNIADMHLHSPVRSREDVPTAVQVDFAADLDVLLGEVIRVAGWDNEQDRSVGSSAR